MIRNIKSVLGLFVPVKYATGWEFTMTIGKVPLGWIMILIAILF